MLKLKIKTNRDRLCALLIILRGISSLKIKHVNHTNYTVSLMQHECMLYAIKVMQCRNVKHITFPSIISVALHFFYDDICPQLGLYEQTFYRELIAEMDKLYHTINIHKNYLLLQTNY